MRTITVSLLAAALVASLIGNVVFYRQRPAALPRAAERRPAAAATPKAIASPVNATGQGGTYTQADLAEWVKHLRALGLPEGAIRSVIAGLIPDPSDAIAAKWTRRRPFWKMGGPPDPREQEEIKAAGAERRRLLTELLGPEQERPESEYETATRQANYGRMSREKVAVVAKLTREFEEIRRSMMQERRASPMSSALIDQEVNAQLNEQLAQALTPEEFEDYRLRRSPEAISLRARLEKLDLTEEEYRALFKQSEAFSRAYGESLSASPLERALRTSEAALEREDAMRAFLGDDRYLEIAREADRYVNAFQSAAIEAGTTFTNTQLIDAGRSVARTRTEALRIVADRSLSDEAARARLTELQQALNKHLQVTLGQAAYAVFAQSHHIREIKDLPNLVQRMRN